MKKTILHIFIYFLIAASISFTLRVILPDWYTNFNLPYGLSGLKSLLQGMGPFLGALIVTRLFKVKRQTTLWGKYKTVALISIFVPAIILAIIGLDTGEGFNTHYYGLMMGLLIIVYAILEESGWRGYLQDELKNVKPLLKYVIIGTLWYVWHFSFLSPNTNIVNELIVLLILIASSWGIGKIAESTHSVALAGCFHSLGNILGLSTVFRDHLPSAQKYILVGICLLVWIPLIIRSERKTRAAINDQNEL